MALLVFNGEALLALEPRDPVWLAAALALAAISHGFSVAFIERFTVCVGRRITCAMAAEVHLRFLPARYLPGGVWHTVGRIEQLRRMRIPLHYTSLLPAIESASALGAATLAGLLLLTLRPTTPFWLMSSVCVIAVCALFLVSALQSRVHAVVGMAASALGFWTSQQLAFGCLVLSLAQPGLNAPAASGSWVLSWAAGHLAVFAPQGVGVTEAVYARLIGSGVEAAFVVLAYRLLQAVADLLAWMAWTAGATRAA